ncbi:ATP-binding protein [Hydrogenophaga sp.]|uniref:ATP-binding protein n=1 Tax=Hydrogenophaga sp. TaxID=1904254 RepID=UPI00271EA4B2|nr:ATP-binding protein [Hydrogenophaga sp.]MDO9437890.1 ATP-binding protein [Hydrogenophaga sp.]
MLFDTQTLLALRLGIDLLIALAFWGLSRRYPRMGGPGWWTLAALLSIVGSLGLWMRTEPPHLLIGAIGNTALTIGSVFSWMGLRAHLQRPLPLQRVCEVALAILLLHTAFIGIWDSAQLRQGLLAFTVLVVMGLAFRDMALADPLRRVPELQALKLLTAVEFLAMLLFAVAAPIAGMPLTNILPLMLFFFLVVGLLRVALYGALVGYRLRLDGDRARQDLLVREADSRALIDNLSAGVVVYLPDHTVRRVNSAARRFFGLSQDELEFAMPAGLGVQMLREDGQTMRRHEMPFDRVLATGMPVKNVVVGVPVFDGGEGDVHWALCNGYAENDAQGGLRHVVLSFIDITSLKTAQSKQKALQAQLAQSQKMEALGTLAGGVAHDFNNILATILGNAELARQDVPGNGSAHESLHEISTAARRGRELVRQILAFSRQQPVERTRVDVCAIVVETWSLMRSAVPSQVQLLHECRPDVPAILADPTQLGQVLINLGTNGVHALGGQPGRVECLLDSLPGNDSRVPLEVSKVCIAAGVGAVRLEVTDTGSGMSEEVRSRIFDPFFTTKAVGQGTGLGLPVVLGIVQMHGGAIEVRSQPGQGTTFTLFFPAAPGPALAPVADVVTMAVRPPRETAAAQPEISSMADEPPADQAHVLYLDDDDTLVFLVRRLLERRGYRVTTFTEQRAAVKAVNDAPNDFQLVLTDFNMPGMSGLDVARAMLAINPRLPVAVASGYITDELQVEAKAAGVREVVFKTDAVEAFCDVVARLVKGG